MNYFCIPSDYKAETLKQLNILNSNTAHYKVLEVYGQITKEYIFPSGRNNIPSISMEELEEYIKQAHKYGIQFNYLLNGSHMDNSEFTSEGIDRIYSFLHRLDDIEVDSVTITLPPLYEIIKRENFKFKVVVSTINQISNVNLANFYNQQKVSRMVLSENITRDFNRIKAISQNVDCDIEIIINSVCFIDCPYRIFHYDQIAQSSIMQNNIATSYYSNRCFLRRIAEPESYLNIAFIRPEDLKYYEEVGVTHFKVQGRSIIANGDIIKTLESYITHSFEGNLMSLLYCFSKKNYEIYIDNKKLDGFIAPFLKGKNCDGGCGNCFHCKNYFDISCKSNLGANKILKDSLLKNDPYNELLRYPEVKNGTN
jgi:collagenase-like PrtC family protease